MQVLRIGLMLGACALALPAFAADAPSTDAVLKNASAMALAGYTDALTRAEALDKAVTDFIANPTDDSLKTARQAYVDARPAYQQTETYRFGNPVVDDWEGRVNSWPLDEGLMDYVDAKSYGTESDENPLYTANVIANKTVLINGKQIDATNLTPEFLSSTLQEAGGIEANVATGYHAIEFLLWGQDLNGTGPGAGNRPATDYSTTACTNGNCDRRAQYLKSAVDLLVSDLKEMVGDWSEGGKALEAENAGGINALFTGMGSLSYGELAGERMKLGLLLHDPEEEHECFSDTTYLSLMNDGLGIQNLYLGHLKRIDGSMIEGPSVSDLVAAKDPKLDTEIKGLLDNTMAKFAVMKTRGDTIEKYDQMIAEGNTEGNKVVQDVIDGLIAQTRGIERATALLGLDSKVEGSDSLDNPDAVFK